LQMNQQNKIKTVDDFIIEIIQEDGQNSWRDFNSKEDILESVRAVIDTMRPYVSEGEIDQPLGTLPRKIQAIFEPSPFRE